MTSSEVPTATDRQSTEQDRGRYDEEPATGAHEPGHQAHDGAVDEDARHGQLTVGAASSGTL